MKVALFGPQAGAGTSTLAALLAWRLSKDQPVYLINSCPGFGLAFYTGFAYSIFPDPKKTNLVKEAFLTHPDNDRLHLAWLKEPTESQLAELEAMTDTIIWDLGDYSRPWADFKVPLIMVTSQDNDMLVHADDKQTSLKQEEIPFLLNRYEEGGQYPLADLDEIYEILHGRCLGTIAFEPSLRRLLNHGRPEELPDSLWQDIDQVLTAIPDYLEGLNRDEADAEPPANQETKDPEADKLDKPKGILAKIRHAFRRGKP